MSDYEPPKTYWDPYKHKQVPVLTQAEVDALWPNSMEQRKDRKDALKDSPLDDAMPSLPAMDAGVPTDYYHGPIPPLPSKAEQVVALNVATAESRGVLPEAARSKVAEGMSEDGTDMVNLPPHYARFKIEPIRFIGENKLDWFQGNIVKYALRWDAKNGVQDIDKVIRTAQMYRLYILGDPDWWKAGKPEDFKVA